MAFLGSSLRAYRRTINRLALYLSIIVGTELLASLRWLMDEQGLIVRHPSWLWWVCLMISILVNAAVATRAMLDGALSRDQQNNGKTP